MYLVQYSYHHWHTRTPLELRCATPPLPLGDRTSMSMAVYGTEPEGRVKIGLGSPRVTVALGRRELIGELLVGASGVRVRVRVRVTLTLTLGDWGARRIRGSDGAHVVYTTFTDN